MTSITKVAIAGATGNLGVTILEHLLDAGFQVTVLTRQGSSHTFPSNATVKAVDYDSLDSLVDALRGQDAFISNLGHAALLKQHLLIEAAIKAGVKRFIPSEFGSDTLNPKVAALPGYKEKIEIQKALKKAAAESGLTYTIILCGPFLDWGVRVPFLVDVRNRTIELTEGGNRKTSVTTLPNVGKAVVGVLKHPEETKNRGVYIQDAAITGKELEEYLKKVVGADGWKENITSVAEGLKQTEEELKKSAPNVGVVLVSSLKAAIWGEGYGGHFQKLDNDLLGIKQLSDAEIVDVLAKNVPKEGAVPDSTYL
ncbi:NAD(P)-binding protein [Hypoxylon sp. FL1857]|nr:NAD(P)-binding protein [Hypoxylon sp. FL1857]